MICASLWRYRENRLMPESCMQDMGLLRTLQAPHRRAYLMTRGQKLQN
jgi:hypothetical protein